MRILLSTIGSRGEVQPLLALALHLRELGHDVGACVPPDFGDLLAGHGFTVVPVGPSLRGTAAPDASIRKLLATPEGRRALAEGSVAAQFAVIPDAARGRDLVIGCGALQIAARSAAELAGAAYVHVHFCPITLPSALHAPPRLPGGSADESDPAAQWEADADRWNRTWREALNAHRTGAGLGPVVDVRSHVFTDRPWLAADHVLGPWPDPEAMDVVQTGAWLLADERPLDRELDAFLDAGEPPVFFGLGSMAAPGEDIVRLMLHAARDAGRRAIVSRGWADLRLPDDGTDCIAIGEANHRALLPRVAAAVHHGGAGTTTVAALSGTPQVTLPQRYDQPYWARRVADLGIGVTLDAPLPTLEALADALDRALQPGISHRAATIATRIRTDGARSAAERLTTLAP